VAIICGMMALGLLWGKKEAAFLGPAKTGWLEQLTVTPGSSTVAASVQSARASSLPQTQTVGGARAGARATDVFWTLAIFAGTCSVCRMAASRSASQLKHGSCTVACQAAEVPTPVMFHPRIPVVEELKPTPTTIAATPIAMEQCISLFAAHTKTPQMMLESQPRHYCAGPSPMAARIRELRTRALRATMVGGARCRTIARSVARHARQHKTRDRAAASRAARRAVGSRLQAASCHQGVPPPAFDASLQRWKIQAGLLLDNRKHSGHMHEIRSPAGIAKKLNGLFTPRFIMLEDFTYSKNLTCASGGQ